MIVWGAGQGTGFHQPEPRRRGQETTVRRGTWLLNFYHATSEEQDCPMYEASPQRLTPPIHVFPRWQRWQLPHNNFSLLTALSEMGLERGCKPTVNYLWYLNSHNCCVYLFLEDWGIDFFLRDRSDVECT